MKRFFSLVCFVVLTMAARAAYSVPYSIDFTTGSLGEWTTQDNNGYPYWLCGTNGAYCSVEYGIVNDDYLISPEISLESGKTYQVAVDFHGNTYGNDHEIYVVYGVGDDVSSYSEVGLLDVVAGGQSIVQFAVDTAADYKIALHNVSDGAYGAVYIPSISIVEVENDGDGAGGGDSQPSAGLSLPYSCDFSSGISDWEPIDANADGITWSGSGYGSGFGICCGEASNYINLTNDDYLLSPGMFALEVGKMYQVTLTIGNFCTEGVGNNVALVTGTGSDYAAYDNMGQFALTASPGTTTVNFSVGVSGNYRIGLHNTCVQSVWYFTAIEIAEYEGGSLLPAGTLLDKDFTDGLLDDWTVLNENNDGAEWHFETGLSGISLTSQRGSTGNHDDWLISPAMTFESDKSYIVSYTISTSGNSDAATVVTAYGTAVTAAAMTEIIANEVIDGTITCYYRISPADNGEYYLGFHAISSATDGNITISVVCVEESLGIIPVAPTGLTAESDYLAQEVVLSWINPIIDTENVELDENITIRIMRDGVQIADIQGREPGALETYIDRPMPFEGETTYQVFAYVSDDKLSAGSEEVTINLDDFSSEATLLRGWGVHRDENYKYTYYDNFSTYGGRTTDWTTEVVNGSDIGTSYPDSYIFSYATSCDRWLISPAVSMSTERRYVIEIELQTSNSYGASFEVYVGDGGSSTALLAGTQLMYLNNVTGNGYLVYETDQFAIDETKDYYFGIRNTSSAQQNYVHGFRIYYYESGEVPAADTPYSETFDNQDVALVGWSMPDATTFAVTGGSLVSVSTGVERNEAIFSRYINLKAGYTYEVVFDYSYAGTGDFTFCMATGQSVAELISGSSIALTGTGTARYLFTPATDGTYCAAWLLVADAEDTETASIDNLTVGMNVYAVLPYSENFENYSLNDIPLGYGNMYVTSLEDGNMVATVETEATTPWFIYDSARDTYNLSFMMKNDAAVTVSMESDIDGASTQVIGTIEEAADLIERTISIPRLENDNEAYNFRIAFTHSGSNVVIDDVAISANPRSIIPAAPTALLGGLEYSGTEMYLYGYYPTVDIYGDAIDGNATVTVTIYCGNEIVHTIAGSPGTQFYERDIAINDDYWTNGVMIFRAVPSVDGNVGAAATAVVRTQIDQYLSPIVEFDFSSDENWTSNGFTFVDDVYTATSGTATLESPVFELEEGTIYMVRYRVITDADESADFSVTVNGETQLFEDAYIGLCYEYNTETYSYEYGYPYFDFTLSRISATSDYSVVISADNIGLGVSINSVTVYAVREYPEVEALPYEIDFDDEVLSVGMSVPNWNEAYTTFRWLITDMSSEEVGAASGSRALTVTPTATVTNASDLIYTPYFTFEVGKTYRLEFEYYQPSDNGALAFVYNNDVTDYEYYATIAELPTTVGWEHYEIDLPLEGEPGATANYTFGFLAFSADVANEDIIAIDDFKIYELAGSSVGKIMSGSRIYYNKNVLNIPADITDVTIYDIQGRIAMRTAETGLVSLAGLSSGVYVVKATDANGAVQTLKVLK